MSFFSRLADRNSGMSQGDRAQMQNAQAAANAANQQRLMQERLAAEQAAQAAQVAAQQAAQQAAAEKQRQAQMIAGAPQQVAMPRPTAVVGAPQQVAARAPTAAAPAPASLAPAAKNPYDLTLAYRRQPPPMMTLAEMDKQRQDTGMYGAMPAVDWRSMKRDL